MSRRICVFLAVLWTLSLVSVAQAVNWSVLPSNDVGRCGHTSVYDDALDRMIVFAGRGSSGYLNSCTQMSLSLGNEAWKSLAPSGESLPVPRAYHTAIVYPADSGNYMVIFGGKGGTTRVNYYSDTWAMFMKKGEEAWSQLQPKGIIPPARESHSAIYDPKWKRMIVFGGRNAATSMNDLWVLDLATLTWSAHGSTQKGPSNRAGHSAVYDAKNERMLVFGGVLDTGLYTTEIWSLDLSIEDGGWTKLPTEGKGAHGVAWHCAVYDDPNKRMLTFAGTDGAQTSYLQCVSYVSSVTGSWMALSPTGVTPPARQDVAAVLDPEDERLVVFGGQAGFVGIFGDAHELSWRPLPT
ncbi:MAG TPA: kelch repeat-containing protein, partial [bacterium]|nr:kelch repeat-containing protein [bacterium]